jgi:chemotaxis protein CheY-P-specific phosphatase CheC
MLQGKKVHYMKTIVIVDRIGKGSRIVDMAKDIDGEIVQMSMACWVRSIAKILHDTVGLSHEIINMSDKNTIAYVRSAMQCVDLRKFI